MEKKKMNKLPYGGKFLQTDTFRCSFNHIKCSLDQMCESFKIPPNLCKTGFDHKSVTRENFMEKRSEWEPYLELDVISLACCITKYNDMMMNLVGQNMQSCISSPQLTLKGWFTSLGPEYKIYSHRNKYIRNFIRRTIKGGRVVAAINSFTSPLVPKIMEILRRYVEDGKDLESMILLMECYKRELLNPTVDIVKSETRVLEDLKQKNPKLMDIVKWCDKNKDHPVFQKDIPKKFFQLREELRGLTANSKDFMMAFDATSLYPSAMWDEESEFPDITSAKHFKNSEEKEILDLFNSQQFRPKTGFFRVRYFNPPELFLQHLPVKETVINDGKKIQMSRFRNGYIEDFLNSVDIQEIVRTGGTIIRIYEGFYYEKNLPKSPFRSYIENLFELRKKYKAEGDEVGQDLIKLLLNSLYGKTVQKDIGHSMHVWSTKKLKANYDDLIMSRTEIRDGVWIVQRKKEVDNVDVTKEESENDIIKKGKKEKTCSEVPHHLGSFILAHARRLMNNFILAIDGFKTPCVAYSDTDSIYISK
jgi:hypothetical protein